MFESLLATTNRYFALAEPALTQLVVTLVILFLGFILGRIVDKGLRKLLSSLQTDDSLALVFKAKRNYARAIRRTIVRIINISTIIVALYYLSIARQTFIVLVALTLLVIAISLILAGLDIGPNVFGRIALYRRHITIGDEIVLIDPTGTVQGTIIDVTITDVRLRRKNGDVFIIPNALFLKDRVIRKKSA